jgi:hypothetical protein
MDRSSDFSLRDTYQWLKKEFPGLQSNGKLVKAIYEELVRAYGNGRDDGLATAAEMLLSDMRARRKVGE